MTKPINKRALALQQARRLLRTKKHNFTLKWKAKFAEMVQKDQMSLPRIMILRSVVLGSLDYIDPIYYESSSPDWISSSTESVMTVLNQLENDHYLSGDVCEEIYNDYDADHDAMYKVLGTINELSQPIDV